MQDFSYFFLQLFKVLLSINSNVHKMVTKLFINDFSGLRLISQVSVPIVC